jgi:hypothetical protein
MHENHRELIPHVLEGEVISLRAKDGYVHATAMCKAAGKFWGTYWQNAATKEFIIELSSVIGIPITELVQSVRGGTPELQGTWVPGYTPASIGSSRHEQAGAQ